MSKQQDDSYKEEVEETKAVVRSATGHTGKTIYIFGILISLIHIYLNTIGTVSELWMSAIHFGLFGVMAALIYPAKAVKNISGARWVLRMDYLLGALALLTALYLIDQEVALFDRGQTFIASDWFFSIAAVLLIIEFARRTTGWVIPVLIIFSMSYMGWWGQYIDGVFNFPGLSWEVVMFRSYFSTEGMFGPIARISSTYAFMFILFGAFLLKSGAGDFLIDLARCAVGRFVGGPGLVAVFGSALMGSISGSAVANTVSTGVITIPMMKRSGFSARFAASVEAAASTGGQLMPPIMGAGAFIMATYTQISYLDIIAVSVLPALLYFLSMMYFVRIEARKQNIIVHEDDIPKFSEVMKQGGHLIIPIAVLVGLLMYGFTPTYAAGLAIVSVIAATWLSNKPMRLMDVLDALSLGARNMTSTAILLIGVGIVVSVVSTTGVGNTFSIMISDWAGGSLMITLILVALASLVLGMGLPVTAAYIVLGTLSAPAIYQLIVETRLIDAIASGQMTDMVRGIIMLVAPEQAGNLGQPMSPEAAQALVRLIPSAMLSMVQEQILSPAVLTTALLSAHMIIFWLSQDSNVTPPVCLTVFAAAAIAGSKPMQTGFTAWKIAKGIYIIPLLFAYTPFLNGDWYLALEIFAWAALGIYALAGAFQGYLEGPVSWRMRPLLVIIGGVLLWPETDYLIRGGALLLLLVIFFLSREPLAKPLAQ